MKLQKAHIFAVVALLLAFGSAGAVWQFYVKERLRELSEHQAQEQKLKERINELAQTFNQTKPDIVLSTWRGAAQPWAQAVDRRAEYFNLGETPTSVTVPEEEIPRFYYEDEYQRIWDELYRYAWENGCQLPNTLSFGVPDAKGMSGQAPGRQEVSNWLTKLEYGVYMTRLLVDANATSIDTVRIWPPREGPKGRRGHISYRSTGYRFSITMKDLVEFLDRLRRDNRYFSIDVLWIYNKQLRNPYNPIGVEMVLTQASYVEKQRRAVAGEGGEDEDLQMSANMNQSYQSGFAALRNLAGNSPLQEEEPGWWERFRKNWLPF